MKPENILIIGVNGQIGKALQAQYPEARAVDSSELDITDKAAVEGYDWADITTILNAAAYTNVDGAESAEGRVAAWMVNADAVANLVAVAAHHNMTLVHISTDYVFDGSRPVHTEDEPFSPLSVYGASKAAGDLAVSLAPKFYLMRTSWVIGEGKNFVRTMLSVGQKGISPTVVADQIGRLTFATEIARAIDHLLQTDAPYGTYNITNDGKPVSWAAVTRGIFNIANLTNVVTDTTTAEYFNNKPEAAPRPLQSTLDLTKLKNLGFTPHDWQVDLTSYINKELQK